MSTRSAVKAILFLVTCYSVTVLGQVIDPVADYPFISVTPASPVAGKDSVNLHLALGSAANACMAPTFTDIAFTIQQSPLAVFPPVYTVSLSYTTVPVPRRTMSAIIDVD